ncbi:MAG TPA: ADP-forming succinate--CoA ligase subunit beta, partial [Acidimicrobiales bacterium]|nr:ADP-forming succinate--CoA ligase subunit beta [Acidimicrobiales bacterium]
MDLFEYQGKQLFASFGIPVSAGEPCDTVEDAVKAADDLGYPVVIKAQVQVGGRGKAGGVKLANNTDEAREHASNILGLDIKGHVVKRVWVEVASDIAEEYYASFTLDRSAKKHLGMLSAEGGVEIEAVAESNPDAISKIWVDPAEGLSEQQARDWVKAAKLNPKAEDGAVDILRKLYTAYTEGDCDLAEINPLILTPDDRVHALDAKVTLDENAAFRHPEWDRWRGLTVMDPREELAASKGLQYVGLEGDVGVIANGAGLAMSTCDVVNQVGGKPANFLDIGGGASAEVMANALEVINTDANVKSIFINIFGGITKGEDVANGIVQALERVELKSP